MQGLMYWATVASHSVEPQSTPPLSNLRAELSKLQECILELIWTAHSFIEYIVFT